MNDFEIYLQHWLIHYQSEQSKIPLFSNGLKLNLDQQQKFSLVFYHARGHFYKFLWSLGSFAPSLEYKKVVLDNISQEFGGKTVSHEQLYIKFANALNTNILKEITNQDHYFDFLQQFNKGHIDWLIGHNWAANWGAFSAYEFLDNTDYQQLLNLVKGFDIANVDLGFFTVHANAKHFESTSPLLLQLWQKNNQDIEAGFDFIAKHQLEMWKNLSNFILNIEC